MTHMFEVVAEGEYDANDDILRCGALTVEISDAIPQARKIQAKELRRGDLLFDAFGGTHPITFCSRRKGSPWITTVREDGWEDRFHSDDTVTIIRPTEGA